MAETDKLKASQRKYEKDTKDENSTFTLCMFVAINDVTSQVLGGRPSLISARLVPYDRVVTSCDDYASSFESHLHDCIP
ncbi:hypothetical protein GHT06_014437 [Daphnia sinensis]|uniref:Uncharacterized protein n=1 Tax=Daphnia sinensis TaxID=1820382 RepID=A0AAD5KTP5_9CRUS|nr:hypothetical protein GHT06_014437 [Daphnia sinensis]